MSYPAHRTDTERFSDGLSLQWIRAVLAEASENVDRYHAAVRAGAPEDQIEAAVNLMYEHLRAKLTAQQIIRAVLVLVDEFGVPKERT